MNSGEQIRKYRKEAQLSQQELGEMIGVSQQMITQYEKGKRIPKFETLEKIADALNISVFKLKQEYTSPDIKNVMVKLIQESNNNAESILPILNNMYGNIEQKEIPPSMHPDSNNRYYYIIGDGDNRFALSDNDIKTLYTTIESFIPSIITILTDRPYSEAFNLLDND